MSNVYATVAQFSMLYDVRVSAQLSNDQNSSNSNNAVIQFMLDMEASAMDCVLNGRVAIPTIMANVPLILTKVVCAGAAGRLYARRNDMPAAVKADVEWAADWIKQFMAGLVTLVDIPPLVVPTLQDSNYPDGQSSFDNAFGTVPSPFGPINTRGNITGNGGSSGNNCNR